MEETGWNEGRVEFFPRFPLEFRKFITIMKLDISPLLHASLAESIEIHIGAAGFASGVLFWEESTVQANYEFRKSSMC
jgi:hypothetical protein